MVTDQGLKSLNIYDIFANIVPGVTFLLGLAIPIDTAKVISTILGENVKFELRITVLLVFAAVAFVIGQFIQALASRYDIDHGFADLMKSIRNEEGGSIPIDITEFEDVFWNLCEEYFILTENFQSYDRLFKAILAFLEDRGRSRALRMQALYLFGRGMFVASLILTFTYIVTAISLFYGYISSDLLAYVRAFDIVAAASFPSAFITYVFYKERKEFQLDWLKYVILEFYLEMTDTERI